MISLTSSGIIKDLLSSSLCLYDGIEVSLHIICCGAVKLAVESVVESLVSRYEQHFTKSRQLEEEHKMQEMEIAENGPILVRAEPVLKEAMQKYWDAHNNGCWHFLRTSRNIKSYEGTEGKTVSKLLKQKSSFPFQDL